MRPKLAESSHKDRIRIKRRMRQIRIILRRRSWSARYSCWANEGESKGLFICF